LRKLGYLKKYAAKYYKLFFLAVFFLSIEAMCDLFQPMMMSKIVDVGIKNRDLHYVLFMGAIMVGITGVGAVGAVLRNNISSRVSQRFGTELRFDLFSKIQSLSYDSADKFDTASLVTRLTNDVTQVQNFVNGMMRIFVKSPLLCIGSIIMSVILEPRLSLIIAVIVPVIVFVIYLNNRIGYPFFKRVQRAIDRLSGVMREFLTGVRVVKAFNRSDYEQQRFSESNDGLSDVQTVASRVTAIFSPTTAIAVNLGIVAVLWFGSFAVDTGAVQVGKIIAFINYMTQMAGSLMMLSAVFTMFVRAHASVERIGEVMNVPEESRADEKPVGEKTDASVEFRDVSFSYSGSLDKTVLSGVSFKLKPGMTLGVIGTTGAGKTTLVSLIPRFYRATGGTVSVNGSDVNALDEHSLRDCIAVVPQKNVLFTGSILENIRWGNKNASRQEIVEAAEIAQIHDFIDAQPEGYDTLLGQGGVNLSGGQKQRLAITRALVRRPSILILDDCTSAVDVITEEKIREGLKRYSNALICILIAQRITSVMRADAILVLDNGKIVGYGRHAQLLQDCSIYRELYSSQFGGEGSDDAGNGQ
jgi:ATP-binding cassette, subfamily B, multidrug efflux pump